MRRAGSSHALGEQSRLATLDRLLMAVLAIVVTSPVWFPLAMLAAVVFGGAQQ
jgi:hypothetical protein